MRHFTTSACVLVLAGLLTSRASADFLLFDSGSPDGRMAMASQPASAGTEIEAADDFITANPVVVTSATFTGLLTGANPTVGEINVEIYRVFPNGSTNPPSGNVPTRVNSPSDVQFANRDSVGGQLTFTTTTLNPSFTAANSVLNGINKIPNQTTGGEGPVTGQEVKFTVTFTTPFTLPADHYFFVPQVQVTGGQFYWLSAPKPVAPPFTFAPDLQAWVRNDNLSPDWLRVGTDVVGGATPPTFNGSFSLTVPEPSSVVLFGLGAVGVLAALRRARAARSR